LIRVEGRPFRVEKKLAHIEFQIDRREVVVRVVVSVTVGHRSVAVVVLDHIPAVVREARVRREKEATIKAEEHVELARQIGQKRLFARRARVYGRVGSIGIRVRICSIESILVVHCVDHVVEAARWRLVQVDLTVLGQNVQMKICIVLSVSVESEN
jgi:hypothetical protein